MNIKINARKRAEELNAFLVRFSDAVRGLKDPRAVARTASRIVVEQLGAERSYWSEIDWKTREYVVEGAFYVEGVSTISGRFTLDAWEPFTSSYLAGRSMIVDDAKADPRLADAEKESFAVLGISADLSVPVMADGELRGILSVNQKSPRRWTLAEIALVEGVAGRCWAEIERARAAEALRASEERLRLALAAARTGIWSWDVVADRHTRDANLNRLLGLTAVETTQQFADLLACIHPDDREAAQTAFDMSVRKGRPLSTEFRIIRPDGEVRWLRDQGDVFGEDGDRARHMAGACVDITDLKEAEAALKSANDELEVRVQARTAELATTLASLEAEMNRRQDLARRLTSAQEDERRRVSRELHDSIGQLLAGLSLSFKAIEMMDGLPPLMAAKFAEAQWIADALGKEVHGLAVRLRPTALDDIGLEVAIDQFVKDWSDRSGVSIDIQVAGLGHGRLSPDVETTVYRVVQEALTNVGKHARAAHASVAVTLAGGIVAAVVEDDGVGFDPESAGVGRLGLLGMRERAALVGGALDIESSPVGGTTVVLRIPVGGEGNG